MEAHGSPPTVDSETLAVQFDDDPNGGHTSDLSDDFVDSDIYGEREAVIAAYGIDAESDKEPCPSECGQDVPGQCQDPGLSSPGTDDQVTRITGQESDGLQTTGSRKRDRPSDEDGTQLSSFDATEPNRGGGHSSKKSRQEPITGRTIPFDVVYYNTRNTDDKNIIVEHPRKSGYFYIISPCTTCPGHWNWGFSPLVSAGGHLAGSGHNLESKKGEEVIKTLGIRVINCTKELAKMNNDAYKEDKPNRGEPKRTKKRKSAQRRGGSTQNGRGRRLSRGGDPDADAYEQECREAGYIVVGGLEDIPPEQVIVNPVPGRVYQSWWEDRNHTKTGWYFATPLPLPPKDFGEIGVAGQLLESRLLSKGSGLPRCYRNPGSLLEWAEGFEDGGPRVTERAVPLLFLEPGLEVPPPGQDFNLPDEAELIAWVSVRNLRPEGHFESPDDPERRRTAADGRAVVDAFKARLEALRRGSTVEQPEANVRLSPLWSRTCSSTDQMLYSFLTGRLIEAYLHHIQVSDLMSVSNQPFEAQIISSFK